MLTIKDLERSHHRMYAPTFQVLLDGSDVVLDLGLEVLSVQVDSPLDAADKFSFVLNGTFNPKSRSFGDLFDLVSFGAAVEIWMGYQDRRDLDLMLTGIVTSVSTSYPSGGLPQVTVGGYDYSYCMLKGKRSRSWSDKTDAEVIALIANEYNLNPIVDDTRVRWPRVEQNQESDYQLLRKLAERNGFELLVFDRDLWFGPPMDQGSSVIELEWGRGLLSFTPTLDIADQVTRVEVVGWNPRKKKEIVGKAGGGDEPGRERSQRSGAEELRRICSDPDKAKLRVRQPVYSQQEAEQRAKAILKSRAERYVTGDGESLGIPELWVDMKVSLAGLGPKFNGDYYVDQTTHTIDGSGYKTRFRVKGTTR